MAGPRPLTRQRSPWLSDGQPVNIGGVNAVFCVRRVSDGYLRAFVAEEPAGWHLSISFVDHKNRPSRYPRWDEITHARGCLLPDHLGFVMHLPPDDHYVALHDTTFHLHEYPERQP